MSNFKLNTEQTESFKYITLISDGAAKHDRFGICDKEGNPLWYGQFFDSAGYNGEQSSSELAAAKKCIWLAGKIREENELDEIGLILKVDAKWLLWANEPMANKKGGKAKALRWMAEKNNVILSIIHISSAANPADYYTRNKGFKKWSDNDFSKIIEETSLELFIKNKGE